MSRHDDRDRVLALAGVFQAAGLVTELARHGQCDQEALNASLDSLFVFDPDTVEAVFGGPAGVRHGLRILLAQLDQPQRRDLEQARYAIALIHHADKLRRDPKRLAGLGEELEQLEEKRSLYQLADYSRSAQIARIYQAHISPVQPQILVRGEPLYLQNPQIAERIRALLLAGIRAAILWRQCGGSRWRLLLGRTRLSRIARELLDVAG
jgi:high frequency lysogenization protein